MKNKSAKKKKPGEKLNNISPEYDSVREQGVLLEDIHRDVKAIAEGHGVLNQKLDDANAKLDDNGRRLDRHELEIQNIKSELMTVKSAVKDVDQRTIKIESELMTVKLAVKDVGQRTIKIEQKLDTVASDHEQRLTKLEAIR